jgi:hypothetical protein
MNTPLGGNGATHRPDLVFLASHFYNDKVIAMDIGAQGMLNVKIVMTSITFISF